MCGIAGVANLGGEPVSSGLVDRMTALIAHRGPDGEGVYTDGPVGLGHRRLAIIDLSRAGSQPMANETGDVVLDYNGEIYNFQRAAGRARGARASLPLAHRLRGRRPRLRGVGRRLRRALQRHVRVRDLGPPHAAGSFSRATASASSRSTGTCATARLRLRLRDEGASSRTRASRATSAIAGAERVLHLPERPHRPDALRRRPAAARRLHADVGVGDGARAARRALLGLPLRRGAASTSRREEATERARTALLDGGRRASWSATCRSAPT